MPGKANKLLLFVRDERKAALVPAVIPRSMSRRLIMFSIRDKQWRVDESESSSNQAGNVGRLKREINSSYIIYDAQRDLIIFLDRQKSRESQHIFVQMTR